MRYGLRWVAALVVLTLMLPTAAGALPAARAGSGGAGWNLWSRIAAVVSAFFGSGQSIRKPGPQTDDGCGYDPTGAPKCGS